MNWKAFLKTLAVTAGTAGATAGVQILLSGEKPKNAAIGGVAAALAAGSAYLKSSPLQSQQNPPTPQQPPQN